MPCYQEKDREDFFGSKRRMKMTCSCQKRTPVSANSTVMKKRELFVGTLIQYVARQLASWRSACAHSELARSTNNVNDP
jgi:hypothetical protein